jgi:hypothetical protein
VICYRLIDENRAHHDVSLHNIVREDDFVCVFCGNDLPTAPRTAAAGCCRSPSHLVSGPTAPSSSRSWTGSAFPG